MPRIPTEHEFPFLKGGLRQFGNSKEKCVNRAVGLPQHINNLIQKLEICVQLTKWNPSLAHTAGVKGHK